MRPHGGEPGAPGSSARPAEMLPPHPNPARSGDAVTLPLRVHEPGVVRVAVYDALGREVAVVQDGLTPAGPLRLTIATSLPAGVYLVRATSSAAVATRTLPVAR